MKLLSDKFKAQKPISLFEELNSSSMNETTSRKIYYHDYQLLRSIAHYKGSTIHEVFIDVMLFCEKLLIDLKYDELPQVYRPAYVVNNHKSIRIPVKYNEFLNDHAGESNMNIKMLISSCIRYYRDFCMPSHFIEMMEFEEQKKQEHMMKHTSR